MSYDVELRENGDLVEVELFEEGGTYAQGGITRADLNVTYNYGKQYWRKPIDGGLGEGGIKTLHKKRGRDVVHMLENSVKILGTKRSSDYWEASDGNAGYTLSILLGWAKQHPNAVFDVS